jgi:hypothetical protein
MGAGPRANAGTSDGSFLDTPQVCVAGFKRQVMEISLKKSAAYFWEKWAKNTGHRGIKLFTTGLWPCVLFLKTVKKFELSNLPSAQTKGGK